MKHLRVVFGIFRLLGKPLYWAVLFSFFSSRIILSSTRTAFVHLRLFLSGERWRAHAAHQATHAWVVQHTTKVRFPHLPRFVFPVLICLLGSSAVALTGQHIYRTIFVDLPTPEDLRRHTPSLTTKIFDRHGVLLYKIYKDENRSLIKYDEIPQVVIDATVSIEDKDFFSHRGVSLSGMSRALKKILTGEGVQGGSTITQQLVKNTLLNRERTLTRKIREIILALQIERHFSKEQILEMYLNESAYGGSVYGIEEAAHIFFGKSARDLTLAESAFLAGLPQAPSLYNPFGSNPAAGISRQHEVLRRMAEDGKISPIQLEQTKNEPLSFVDNVVDLKAPHFVMYVREQLAREFGDDVLAHAGLHITTTLDLSLQEDVQKIVTDEVKKLKHLRISNGAALVTNPKTGEILAMVGSTNYFDSKNDGQVNVTIRERQPGSSIKPVTYAAALERGLTPATLIDDTPVTYTIPGSPPYSPKNYDGRYHGKVSVRTALASSYNIPAVKVEASIGLNTVIEKGRQMGITTWEDSSRFGLSLTLGAGEIRMVDMAKVYGTFANTGVTVPLQFVREIKTAEGKVLVTSPCQDTTKVCGGQRTLDPRIAYQITNILMDNTARSPAFGTRSVLAIPKHEVAVKTGTTNLLRDNWTNGYTSEHVVLVWVGNNDNSPMARVTSGIIGASPIWNQIMTRLLPTQGEHRFPIPNGLYAQALCRNTSSTPCGGCNQVFTEYFLPGTQIHANCPPASPPAVASAQDWHFGDAAF